MKTASFFKEQMEASSSKRGYMLQNIPIEIYDDAIAEFMRLLTPTKLKCSLCGKETSSPWISNENHRRCTDCIMELCLPKGGDENAET